MRPIVNTVQKQTSYSSYSSNYSSSNYGLSKSKSFQHFSVPSTPTKSTNFNTQFLESSSSRQSTSKKSYMPNRSENVISKSSGGYLLQKSHSISDAIESNRGFKPSDRKDPNKREFLQYLTQRVFKVGLDEIGPRNPINLEKIFTPAEDCIEIKPNKNRKMFASSAFYDSGFHPTVEDQVELARKISSSLSDVSNKSSKGQNMYVNRKKRSVKWVHEDKETQNGHFQNGESSEQSMESKSVLKLVMNPLGQVQDIDSLKKQGFAIETALSPDIYAGIVKDLNSPNGKGAELFAKRRKRSEKWIVGETNGTKNGMDSVDIIPSPAPMLSPLPPLSSFISPAPGYLPETTQRIQHKEKLDEIQAQFIRPKLKLIKSPWEAALETGSVDTAFENIIQPPSWGPTRGAHVAPTVANYEQALQTNTLDTWKNDNTNMYQPQSVAYNNNSINRIVDNLQKGSGGNVDLYKPKLPQAWNQQQGDLSQPKQYSSNTLPRNLTPSAPAHKVPSPIPTLEAPVNTTEYATYAPPKENIPPPKIHNLSFVNQYGNLQNYNTAARGWTQKQAIYKPVTFGNVGRTSASKQQGWDYTDF